MIHRLPWQRSDQPQSFIAYPTGDPAGGSAEVYFAPYYDGHQQRWQVRVTVGSTRSCETIEGGKQAAADRATELWPLVVEQERLRVARLEEDDDMLTMLTAARNIGAVTVEAFEVATAPSDRLRWLIWQIRKIGLGGPLQALAETISAELYRRRLAGSNGPIY